MADLFKPNDGSSVLLEASGMTKRFGSVSACDHVDLSLFRGEIHGVLGDNGAGKSTLMKMLIGLVLPGSGSIRIDGELCKIIDPLHAAELGIGMVHQHYSLVDALTVWENVALGETGALDRDMTRERVMDISERYGLEIDPDASVRDLSAGLRQRVEIIKCLRHEPRILILDEPTSVLTPAESEQLFEVLGEGVRSEGWAVALVSHKLDEVLSASDRITIMRDGKVIDQIMTADADAASLAHAMVGRAVTLRSGSAAIGVVTDHEVATGVEPAGGETAPAMEIDAAVLKAADGAALLDGLSLNVNSGEIVGIAGVEGNGQTPLVRMLASLLTLDDGAVRMYGREVPSGVAGAMRNAGIVVIPADRHHSGCVPQMSVAENLALSTVSKLTDRGFLRRNEIRERALRLIEEFDIHTPGPDVPLGQLSGGNQQRVVLAGALSDEPEVLVAHQPTRGLDVGANEYIGERLRVAADQGIGVLLISTDLGEVVALADRILVIHRGAIVGEMTRAELDVERLGLLVGGSIPTGGAA